MAYSNLLASVPMSELIRLQGEPLGCVAPTSMRAVSHLLANGGWVTAQPLGELLRHALDGGRPLPPVFWHPLRPPVYHEPPAVVELLRTVADAWRAVLAESSLEEDDWLRCELTRLLDIFGWATKRGEAIVSALDPPADSVRARRCRLPWRSGGCSETVLG